MVRNRTTSNSGEMAEDEPCYVISIAARLVGMHQQIAGATTSAPGWSSRSARWATSGCTRTGTSSASARPSGWIDELGVNLAGVAIRTYAEEEQEDFHVTVGGASLAEQSTGPVGPAVRRGPVTRPRPTAGGARPCGTGPAVISSPRAK